jgi:hypothetical protein
MGYVMHQENLPNQTSKNVSHGQFFDKGKLAWKQTSIEFGMNPHKLNTMVKTNYIPNL